MLEKLRYALLNNNVLKLYSNTQKIRPLTLTYFTQKFDPECIPNFLTHVLIIFRLCRNESFWCIPEKIYLSFNLSFINNISQ